MLLTDYLKPAKRVNSQDTIPAALIMLMLLINSLG